MSERQGVATDLRNSCSCLPFSAVNRRGSAAWQPDLQRHHLLPRQVIAQPALARMLRSLDPAALGFHDFRRNGILLPARASAAARMSLPLHRGPHRDYSRMVFERMGRLEMIWARQKMREPEAARAGAELQIALLQRALRRRILDTRRPLQFNRNDPLGAGRDFSLLDRLAEDLWVGTG